MSRRGGGMILVTGAAGFIGSNLVATLNASGRTDLILCDWVGEDDRRRNLTKRAFNGVQSPDQLECFLASSEATAIDIILHMGAITDTLACDRDLLFRWNYQFTKMLWNWSVKSGATFIYASSAATYGDGSHDFNDECDLDALRRLCPLNLYAWSKHSFDIFALGSPVTPPRWYGLKFFNVFGPNEYHKGGMQSIVSKQVLAIRTGQRVQLFMSHRPDYPDGGQLRDFIYVIDVCAAVSHLMAGVAPSGLYNVGTGEARSFHDLVSAAYRATGHEPAIEYVEMPDALRARYQYFTQATTQKLRASGFGHAPASLEDGVTRYIQDYLLQDDPYR